MTEELRSKAYCLYRLERYDEAIALLRQVLASSPSDAKAEDLALTYGYLGECLRLKGQPAEALQPATCNHGSGAARIDEGPAAPRRRDRPVLFG